VFWPIHFASRDAMACAAIRYFDKFGPAGLPTVEEALAAEERRKEERAQEEAEREERRKAAALAREAREKEEAERRDVARMALNDLETRIDLTNVERAGLAAIRKLLSMEQTQ